MALGKKRKSSIVKMLSLLLLIGGSVFLFLGATGIWTQHISEEKALNQAKMITTEDHPPFKQVESKPVVHSFHPKIGQVIGVVRLPTLNTKLPIIQGTGAAQLKKGVGHYAKSSFPGRGNQVVLSGHRDTVFRHLGDLQKGDPVIIKLPFGSFTYNVDHTKIVKANNQNVIHPSDREELVLTTCYPFYYIGNAPNRYIVYAYPSQD